MGGQSTISLTGPKQDIDAIVQWLTHMARRKHERGYPEVAWDMDTVEPPSQSYVTRDSVLNVTVWNVGSLSTPPIISAKILLPNGKITVISMQPKISATVPQTFTMDLIEGFLLSVDVAPYSVAGTYRGLCYITIGLVTADPSGAPMFRSLIADYLTSAFPLAWPDGTMAGPTTGTGNLASSGLANPAAGADFSFAFNANSRTWMHGFTAILTTSSTAANRVPQFTIKAGNGNVIWTCAPNAVQVASKTYSYNLSECITLAADYNGNQYIPLPAECWIVGAGSITSTTAGIQTTDQWSGIVATAETWLLN